MSIPTVPLPPPPRADAGEVFGPIGDYALFTLRSPLRHRRLAAGVVAGCFAIGVVASLTLPRKYQVETTVLAQRNPLMAALSNPSVNRDWDTPTRAAREIVIRRDNLVALCRQTAFAERYLATRAPAVRARDWIFANVLRRVRTPAQLEDDLVSALETRLTVWVSQEGAVTIGFTWSDPDIAHDVVGAALQSFLEARNAAEMGAVGEAIAILQGHDARIQQEIAEAIRKLEAKEQSLRIRIAPRRQSRARPPSKQDEELVRLQGLLSARRRALADLEDSRQRRTSELQVQLSQQLAMYGPQHPNVVGTRQALAGLNMPSPQAGALRGEISQLEKAIAQHPGGAVDPGAASSALEDDVAAARAALLDQADPRLEYERRQLESLLRRHSSLLERIESARIELDTARSAFEQRYTIIAPPRRPKGPLRPYGFLYVAGSLFAGAVLACVGAAAADLSGGRVIEAWQVRRSLDLPLFGDPGR